MEQLKQYFVTGSETHLSMGVKLNERVSDRKREFRWVLRFVAAKCRNVPIRFIPVVINGVSTKIILLDVSETREMTYLVSDKWSCLDDFLNAEEEQWGECSCLVVAETGTKMNGISVTVSVPEIPNDVTFTPLKDWMSYYGDVVVDDWNNATCGKPLRSVAHNTICGCNVNDGKLRFVTTPYATGTTFTYS